MMWLVDHRKSLLQGGACLGTFSVLGVALAWSPAPAPGTRISPDTEPVGDTESTAALQESAQEADVVSGNHYAQVQRLRRRAALTDHDLAALGLTSEQAEAVLGRLLEWTRANEASLITARRGVLNAKRALADAERAQRVGAERGGKLADLDDARAAVVLAERSRLAVYDQGALYALSVAPASTQEQWRDAAVFRGRGLPVELRYLSSMTERRADELAEALGVSSVLPDQTLTGYEASGVSDVRARINTHLQGVFTAEGTVLPLPAALRDDEAGMLLDQEPPEDGRP